MEAHLDALAAICRAALGPGEVTQLRQLSGGASMESWRFSYGDRDWVLRRLPFTDNPSDPADNDVGAISLATQAGLIAHLHQQGIRVPEIVAQLPPEGPLGQGFIMACMPGEALPGRLLNKPEFTEARAVLSRQCARELAAIHAFDPASLPVNLPTYSPRQLLEEQERYYRQFGSSNPVLELAFAFLTARCPESSDYRLVHADFRMGNFLVDAGGLTAVLDWELAHIGDPLRDLSFLCTPSWRFGHYGLEAGGFATLDAWLADYAAASGRAVARENFDWWMVFNTLWWGVTCLRMGSTYRDGSVPIVERTVIGRRVSEVEVDLLLQLATYRGGHGVALPLPETAVDPRLPTAQEISYPEVMASLRDWALSQVTSGAGGHTAFEARVANNALGIASRALQLGPGFEARQSSRLAAMGVGADALCQSLRDDFSACEDKQTWDHLRLLTLERLVIDQPKYAGLAVAMQEWCAG